MGQCVSNTKSSPEPSQNTEKPSASVSKNAQQPDQEAPVEEGVVQTAEQSNAEQVEEQKQEAAVEEKQEEAAVEEKQEEAAVEEKQEEAAAAEEKQEEAAVEEKQEEAAVEEKQEAVAAEEKQEEAAAEEKQEEAAAEEKQEEAAAEEKQEQVAAVAAAGGDVAVDQGLAAITFPAIPVDQIPLVAQAPAPVGEIVSDDKVQFDKAALQIPGVFATREAEVAQLNKALDVKKEAGAATAQANELHQEANKLYEAGDKDGNKAKMEESKKFRELAKEKHQESFDLAYAGALSMGWKAVYSQNPEVDYHVFLLEPYERSFPVVLEMVKQNKFNVEKFLVIPGAGTHSDKDKGPKIKPAFLQWCEDNKIEFTEETHGSYLMTIPK